MRSRHALPLILAAALLACGGDSGTTSPTTTPPPPPPPPPAVQLEDVAVDRLPSPYYHFAYGGDGRVSFVSFASDLTRYDVTYDAGGRLAEMRNNTIANHDRLQYVYDDAGRVGLVKYLDASDRVYTTVFFTYDGEKLKGIERDRRVDGGFIIDKTVALSYDADGNLFELTTHRPAIAGRQAEETTVDRYEGYDDGINVDGFGLIHDDFFDHLVLLPGVQLQKNNPARETRTGDGINYTVDYVYTYDAAHRPRVKSGDLTVTRNDPNVGRHFQTRSSFSYY